MNLTELQIAFQKTIITIPKNNLTRLEKIRIQNEVTACGKVLSDKKLDERQKYNVIRFMGVDWNETAYIMDKFLTGIWK